MEITREIDYAIRCILSLSITPNEIKNVTSISKEMGISGPFVSKILQKLSQKGFVVSIRGIKGGFRLNRKPADIALLDVVEAIGGSIPVNKCVIDSRSCERIKKCSVHSVWVRLQKMIIRELKSVNFKTLSLNKKQ